MRTYRFLDHTLQTNPRRLLGPDGQTIELTPRLYDALLFLVERPGELLDKDRLLTELWPGLVVEENSLSQSVSALRRALRDDAQRSRFIQTVHRRGFRFVAPVVAVEDAPKGLDSGDSAGDPAPKGPTRSPADATIGLADAVSAPGRRQVVALAAATVASGAAGLLWWQARAARETGPSKTVRALAVLPFKPIVANSNDELLEIGMAESIVSRLSNLPGVAVRSIGSVRRFRGADQDPISAAQALNVTWIIDGSVQRSGTRVRVSARLLNTASGEAEWSGSFDENYTDVFALQDSISMKVARVLAPHLQRRDRQRLAGAGGTRNVDAYQIYLAARQNAEGIKAAGLTKSIELYRQAIALDPAFAQAWSGLGESYRRLVFGADGEPRVVMLESAKANARAVMLDPDLAEAHAGIGWNRFWGEWDWAGAAAVFDRAIALNASDASAHFGYSQLLDTLGRDSESLDQLRQARESDPMSLILLTIESGSLLGAGRIAEASERLQRVFDIDPDFWVAHMVRSSVLRRDGQADAALQSLALADQLADGSSQAAAALGYLLARSGQTRRAQDLLQRLLDRARTRYVPPTSAGLIYAGLGDRTMAMAALEQGYAVRDVRMTLVWNDGRWGLVSKEPRFLALKHQMKLA